MLRFVPQLINMISYLKGPITFKSPTRIIVEAGGIGYDVNISLNTYAQVEKLESIKIFTVLIVKEDSHTLFGFFDTVERKMFIYLVSVSGIGAITAQVVLSSMKSDELRHAIIAENDGAFKKVKGIGPKTAKRLILDLKDKMIKEGDGETVTVQGSVEHSLREEAIGALLALGFNKIKAQKTINQILGQTDRPDSVEGIIKKALNLMT